VTGNGQVTLRVDPWLVPSGRTRGGNLDVLLELVDASEVVVATNNPASQTYAQIQTTLSEGLYFLKIRNTGTGTPETSPPSGYTSYGSVGQYFLSGSIVPSAFAPLPLAELQVDDLRSTGQAAIQIDVIYSDNLGIDVATIDSTDLLVTGPSDYAATAQFDSLNSSENGTPRVASYQIAPPQGLAEWTAMANGIYSVWMQADQVGDVEGGWVEARLLGTFVVDVPVSIYAADMDADPGWSMEPLWGHGTPGYSGGSAPSSGATGTKIVAYNLEGDYQNSLSEKYATTPVIDARGHKDLTLRFQQWLRMRNGDTATIQVTINGVDWTDLWSSTRSMYESAWQEQQFDLPDWTDGAETLQLRWGIVSSPSQNNIGWNIDDVELTGLVESSLNSTVTLAVTVNNPDWGQVSPMSNSYPAGTAVTISATPEEYYSFAQWTGDLNSSENPLNLILDTDTQLEVVFAEIVTTNHSVPYWWLAGQGVVSDFESSEEQVGSNGVPLWQSFVAGLDPDDPESKFLVTAEVSGDGGECVLYWDPVPGRVYTVLASPDSAGTFLPVPGAASLPDSVTSFTNVANPNLPMQFYRLEVSLP
jgi:hypothetical protein